MENENNSKKEVESENKGYSDDERCGEKRPGKTSRRTVLRATGAISATGAVFPIGTKGERTDDELMLVSKGDSESLESVYQSSEISQIQQEYPSVDLTPKDVQSVVTNSESEVLAANVAVEDGTLSYIKTDNFTQANVMIEEKNHDIATDWPSETTGFIRAVSDTVTFIRTTTTGEAERILNRIRHTDIEDPDESDVYIIPERESYLIQKYDYDAGRVELLRVSSEVEPRIDPSGGNERRYHINAQYTYGEKMYANTSSTNGCNTNSETAVDIFLCLKQIETCSLCAPSIVGGPQAAVACMLLVCLGSYTAVEAAIDELDTGCSALLNDLLSCWDEWTDFL